jgi:hypothetical protein
VSHLPSGSPIFFLQGVTNPFLNRASSPSATPAPSGHRTSLFHSVAFFVLSLQLYSSLFLSDEADASSTHPQRPSRSFLFKILADALGLITNWKVSGFLFFSCFDKVHSYSKTLQFFVPFALNQAGSALYMYSLGQTGQSMQLNWLSSRLIFFFVQTFQ